MPALVVLALLWHNASYISTIQQLICLTAVVCLFFYLSMFVCLLSCLFVCLFVYMLTLL